MLVLAHLILAPEGRKEGHTNVQISAELGTELGSLWLEGKDLTSFANHASLKAVTKKSGFKINTKLDTNKRSASVM